MLSYTFYALTFEIMQSPRQHIDELIHTKLIARQNGDSTSSEILRMPTIKELAKKLSTRDHVIRQIYQELSNTGKIETTRGRGTFLVPPKDNSKIPQYFRFGVNINPDNGNPQEIWRARIYEGIFNASVECHESIALIGFKPSEYGQALSDYDGCFLFFSTASDQSLQKIVMEAKEGGKPWISIDPPSLLATNNFVSAQFFEDGVKIGRSFKASGRKHIVVLCNHSWEDSVSFRLRFHGLAEGLGLGDGLKSKLVRLQSDWISAEAGRSALRDYIEKNGYPDAVVASGDFLALGCLRYLTEQGLKVREDFSIVGGTGVDLSTSEYPGLTRTAQPLQQLGKTALELLLKQVYSTTQVPGVYLPVSYWGGDTTTEEENKILFS